MVYLRHVRVASFNIQHGLRTVSSGFDRATYVDAIAELDADVLALQEVDVLQPRTYGLDQAALAGEAIDAVDVRFAPTLLGTPGERWRPAAGVGTDAPITDGDGPAYGLALASRYPVRSWHQAAFPAAPGRWPILVPGRRTPVLLADEPRAVIAAVVEVPGGVLTVATTHLSFAPGWNTWQLRRVIRFLRPLPAPRILIGDLNIPGRIARLAGGDWKPLVSTPTYPAREPRIQFDHALGHGGVPPLVGFAAPALGISDHRALVLDLADRSDVPH